MAYVPTYINPADAPSRLSAQTDIQEAEQNIWPIRCGSVCNKTEQEAIQILQLLLLLSPIESNTTYLTESSTEKYNYDNNNANVEICDLQQISFTQEQILVAGGMENQQRAFQKEGLTDLALDIITANTRSANEDLVLKFFSNINSDGKLPVVSDIFNLNPNSTN
ncbi:hypothetical protein BB561_006057 [Smittium simulii]|uniref:Uncharacterized protein n=1 Tax=Smittium simulii TaxID=133385 RepID=A0A2T9Y6S2_9FUNG|nr:hypothetical protein BB561_006057 [Smittium simulii]